MNSVYPVVEHLPRMSRALDVNLQNSRNKGEAPHDLTMTTQLIHRYGGKALWKREAFRPLRITLLNLLCLLDP